MPIYYLLLLLLGAACQTSTSHEANLEEGAVAHHSDNLPVQWSKEALLGKVNPARDSAFTLIDRQYTEKEGIYLRKPAYEAFVRMARAAREAGVSLQIVSATRNFAAQKSIWEAKWNGQRKVDGQDLSQTIPDPATRALKILEYSSMPGTSRHHWGTDIDLNDLNNEYFATGQGKKVYDWLVAHGAEYGFCQVYTEQGEARPEGYQEEKWHWSYMPLASPFLQQYNTQVSYDDLGGFAGEEAAEQVEAIQKYVNGIAPPCRDWREE